MKQKERAVIFIDGSNFYHGLREIGLSARDLDYAAFSQKLILDRAWTETRYYTGQVRQEGDLTRYAKQRKFLSRLQKTDRVNYFLGRIETQPNKMNK